MEVFPFRPGDWVADRGERVAKVKGVCEDGGEVFLDLVIYSDRGDRIGRESPAMGGPRTFEPMCAAEGWERIDEPVFPIRVMWVDDGTGRRQMRRWAADRLPPANWKRPKPKPRKNSLSRILGDLQRESELERALKAIAEGHNDARALAEAVLGKRRRR